MKAEAIEALQQFKQMHLAMEAKQQPEQTNEQADTVSESSSKPKRTINYPKHIKPLQERIMSAVGNGCRTAKAITTYCGEDRVKVVNMHLGRLLSAGKLVRYTNSSGFTRYYTPDEAKAKGYKPDAQPKKAEKRSSSYQSPAPTTQLTQAEAFVLRGEAKKNKSASKDYIAFLEKRIAEWQAESRKQAHEIAHLQDETNKLRNALSKAMERHGVAEEVTKLRATVEYLESKLFGGK